MDKTMTTLYSLWYCTKRKNVSYLFILPTIAAIDEIKECVKWNYNSCNEGTKIEVEMTNKLSKPNVLNFNNGSKIVFSEDLKEMKGYESLSRTYMSECLEKIKFNYIFIHHWCYTRQKDIVNMIKKNGKVINDA